MYCLGGRSCGVSPRISFRAVSRLVKVPREQVELGFIALAIVLFSRLLYCFRRKCPSPVGAQLFPPLP